MVSVGYRLGSWLHRLWPRTATSVNVPVISVGNVTVGGTGKTPRASALALLAREEGLKAAIVLRGYRGTVCRGVERVDVPLIPEAVKRFGDEACLHAQALSGPVYVARKRIAGVLRAAEEGCDLAILDDGMQHRRLARDLEIELRKLLEHVDPKKDPDGFMRGVKQILSSTFGPTMAETIASRIIKESAGTNDGGIEV